MVVPSASDEEQASRPNLLDRLGIDWNAVPTTPIPESFDQGGALAASTQGSAEAKSGSDSAETIEDEGGNVVVAPIPFVSPTIGYGLALGGAYLVKLDPKSPPSTIGVGALYSENNSYGGGLFFKGFFAEDRVRVTAGIVATRLNFDLRVADQDIALRENVLAFGFEVLIRSFERVFIGPQLIVSGIDTDVVRSSDIGVIPDDELEAFNLGVGLRAQRDTRDSTFYPRTGSFADAQLRVFNESLGSDFDYQVLPAAYNHYLSPSSRDVVALRHLLERSDRVHIVQIAEDDDDRSLAQAGLELGHPPGQPGFLVESVAPQKGGATAESGAWRGSVRCGSRGRRRRVPRPG